MAIFSPVRLLTLIGLLLLPAQLHGQSLADLYEKVNPSVVVIESLSLEATPGSSQGQGKVTTEDQGSGVLIDEQGTILTASHVVQTAEHVTVEFLDGQRVQAEVIASAHWGDIALIRVIDKVKLPTPAMLADSDTMRVGDRVFVVGTPFGYSHSLSAGYISQRLQTNAMIGSGTIEVFQTDAAMNPGNSGGPLFNMQGEVIGIASHISTIAGGFDGIAFAVTTNQCRLLMERVETWSGIEGIIVTESLARLLNVPQPHGLLVQKVSSVSWGGKVGLQPGTMPVSLGEQTITLGGDIILKVGGMEVDNEPEFFKRLGDYVYAMRQAGKQVPVKVLRGGKVLTLGGEKGGK